MEGSRTALSSAGSDRSTGHAVDQISDLLMLRT